VGPWASEAALGETIHAAPAALVRPGAPLLSEDGTRNGRPGAATLDCVDDLKARAASADQEGRARLSERLRQVFIEGAEEDSRRHLRRGLTQEELDHLAPEGRD
jgi:hypothetical protein